MTHDDKRQVITTIAAAYAYYERELTEFAMTVWLEDLEGHSPEAIARAFVAHRRDPQRGQWMPKSADILRQLQPDERDSTAIAWSHLLAEVRRVGSYGRPSLDDVTRSALGDIGGWGAICRAQEDELPFLAKRFADSFGAHGRAERRESLALDLSAVLPRLQ